MKVHLLLPYNIYLSTYFHIEIFVRVDEAEKHSVFLSSVSKYFSSFSLILSLQYA